MRNRIIIPIFCIFIAFGLLCGLLYSLNINLDSDMAVPGLVAIEIFKHGNIQFTYPLDDPYLFTDVYTFYLIPQFLSGFNPTVLRWTAFFVFLLVVAVFSYIVYRYAGLVNALIFAALLVNVSPAAYHYFLLPEYHVGTLLAAGVMIFLFDYDKVKSISFNRILIYVLFMALIVLSDYLIFFLFIIPYIACYLLVYRKGPKGGKVKKKQDKVTGKGAMALSLKEIKNIDTMIILMVLASAIVWLFKAYEPEFLWQIIYFNPRGSAIPGLYQVFILNIPLYVQCISYLVNQGLYNIANFQFSLIDIPIALVFIITVGYSFTKWNAKAKYLYLLFLASSVTAFLSLIFSNFASGLWSVRFLLLTAVSIFIVIALAYDDKTAKPNLNLLFLVAVIALILSAIPYNLQKVSSLDYQPNKADYELIDYLKENNLTHAYSHYDQSNILTYLSNEGVEVRTVNIQNNKLILYKYTWLGSSRWYANGIDPTPTFIVEKDSEFHGELSQVFANMTPIKTYEYNNYKIYVMPPPA